MPLIDIKINWSDFIKIVGVVGLVGYVIDIIIVFACQLDYIKPTRLVSWLAFYPNPRKKGGKLKNQVILEYCQNEGMFLISDLASRIEANIKLYKSGGWSLNNRQLLGVFQTLEECTEFYRGLGHDNENDLQTM